jgi:hypothetical protein
MTTAAMPPMHCPWLPYEIGRAGRRRRRGRRWWPGGRPSAEPLRRPQAHDTARRSWNDPVPRPPTTATPTLCQHCPHDEAYAAQASEKEDGGTHTARHGCQLERTTWRAGVVSGSNSANQTDSDSVCLCVCVRYLFRALRTDAVWQNGVGRRASIAHNTNTNKQTNKHTKTSAKQMDRRPLSGERARAAIAAPVLPIERGASRL